MYRRPEEYDKAAISAIQIYCDYRLRTFPLNPFALCQKMGITVIPYSLLNGETLELSKKKTNDGYSLLYGGVNGVIFYNDDPADNNSCRIEFTILHELKHIIDNDYIDDDLHDDLSDYFAKYMKCPIQYLVVNDIVKVVEIIRVFNVNQNTAEMVSANVKNRIAKYGHGLFEYEIPLLVTITGNSTIAEKYDII